MELILVCRSLIHNNYYVPGYGKYQNDIVNSIISTDYKSKSADNFTGYNVCKLKSSIIESHKILTKLNLEFKIMCS